MCDMRDMIQNHEEITARVVEVSMNWLAEKKLYPTEYQKKALESHIKEMVLRSQKLGNPLPEVDLDLFSEISESSLNIAKRVVDLLIGLPIEEAYLLAIHFEVMEDKS